MKPSERIQKLAETNKIFEGIALKAHDYIGAIMDYLDEQYLAQQIKPSNDSPSPTLLNKANELPPKQFSGYMTETPKETGGISERDNLIKELDVYVKTLDRFNDEKLVDGICAFILADRKRINNDVSVTLREWLIFAKDVQPGCYAGEEQLRFLVERTEAILTQKEGSV